jgi:hypothetical protein
MQLINQLYQPCLSKALISQTLAACIGNATTTAAAHAVIWWCQHSVN